MFADIVGHDHVKRLLARSLREGRVPPAILLAGPEGVGKRSLALEAVRALLCVCADGDACGLCSACQRASRGVHPDAFLIEPVTAAIKIEQVRDVVREIDGRPFEGRARGFVIDDAHAMTEQAQNALLKSLEEPPPTSHVFLVTASPQTLLPTVRSRCQWLRMGPLPAAVLEKYLREVHGLSAEEARLRASLSGGSVGLAQAFDSEAYQALRELALSLLEGLGRAGPMARMEFAKRLEDLEDPVLGLTALRSLLRDTAALRVGLPADRLMNADLAPRLSPLAGTLGARAGALADAVEEARTAFRGNAHKLLTMDLLLEALGG